MSELIQKNDNRATIRWKLLTGASALALTAYVSSAGLARAEDSGQPQVWIELGGDLSRLQDGQETFAPPVMDNRPSIFSPSAKFDKPPLYGIDEFADISFRPEDSNWVFSASIRYGRSANARHVHQQTYPGYFHKYYSHGTPFPTTNIFAQSRPVAARFADTRARTSERYSILDFQAGKDVGLGLFGNGSSSTVSLGVRIAQFGSKTTDTLKSDPNWHFLSKYFPLPTFNVTHVLTGQIYQTNSAALAAQRSFRGVGPSISWKASTPIAGNAQDGALTLDWGLNAAALFGRQKTKTHHQSTADYHRLPTSFVFGTYMHIVNHYTFPNQTRSRSVTVPNVGGSVGLSWQLQDFKMSFGYKADFFFGAIDGGIDARKNENRAFFGPYASISVGLGD